MQLVMDMLIVAGLAVLMVLPFYWMVITALSPAADVIAFPPKWIPSRLTLESFQAALAQARWLVYYGNSLVVAVISHYGTRLWEIMSGKELTPPSNGRGALAFSPDGGRLAMQTFEGTVHVWAVATNSELARVPCEACEGGLAAVAFSPDSRWLATAPGGGSIVQVWDVASRKVKEVARVVPG